MTAVCLALGGLARRIRVPGVREAKQDKFQPIRYLYHPVETPELAPPH